MKSRRGCDASCDRVGDPGYLGFRVVFKAVFGTKLQMSASSETETAKSHMFRKGDCVCMVFRVMELCAEG